MAQMGRYIASARPLRSIRPTAWASDAPS